MIELPPNFASGLATSTTAQIGQFSGVLNLVIGLLLAVSVIGLMIKFFK